MERTYVVEGKWPFPLDMLRHDQSRPATAEDQRQIDIISGDATVGIDAVRCLRRIALIMEGGDHINGTQEGRWAPNQKRWRSFGWEVVEGVEEWRKE